MNYNKQNGFTLIELMVTVAILGILAAYVIPNYRNHIAAAKFVEGQSTLNVARNSAEQFFQDNRSYTGMCTGNTPASTTNFSYTCVSDASSYLFTASANAGSGVDGWAFTIDQNNSQATSGVPAGVTAPIGCWAKKTNGHC